MNWYIDIINELKREEEFECESQDDNWKLDCEFEKSYLEASE